MGFCEAVQAIYAAAERVWENDARSGMAYVGDQAQYLWCHRLDFGTYREAPRTIVCRGREEQISDGRFIRFDICAPF